MVSKCADQDLPMDHRWSPHTARNPIAVPVQNPINKDDVENPKNEGKNRGRRADSMWRFGVADHASMSSLASHSSINNLSRAYERRRKVNRAHTCTGQSSWSAVCVDWEVHEPRVVEVGWGWRADPCTCRRGVKGGANVNY